jgi:hypothetical protein
MTTVVPFIKLRLTQREKDAKLRQLAYAEDYESVEEMFQVAATDSIAPCVCIRCGATAALESDQDKGWCHECDHNTMVSCLVLAGLI